MSKKAKKTDDLTLMLLKLEVAEELGLLAKVKELGWGGLTAEETGKIGGYMTQKIKLLKQGGT
ncbi:MAG: alpha/beta-type small acid-soluble spore protein [Halanaerobiales bacterium]|nr:alpha/beta-type small acid-soluble spore protein [Halanaerobiales bacterium]